MRERDVHVWSTLITLRQGQGMVMSFEKPCIHYQVSVNGRYPVRRLTYILANRSKFPDNKVHGAHMGTTWDRQDPGGPHVGPMNLAIRVVQCNYVSMS